jgi:tetratricopeptide (TPR) repeat protein
MKPIPASNTYYALGPFHRSISTVSPDAQTWFNRGLVWVYAFNHAEGVYCFRQAIAHDPRCAMAYWGLAYAVGPNYNKPWERFDRTDLEASARRGFEAAREAKRITDAKEKDVDVKRVAPWEQAVIEAIQTRYESPDPPADPGLVNRRYAAAMASVYQAFGEDIEIAVLYADALMNVTPWALWNLFTGEPAVNAPTMLVKSVLEGALAREHAHDHPGLLHLYIHYIEMSPTPELGIKIADRLRELVPDAGHLHHMPTHLDILVGDWRRSITSNQKATLADEKYLANVGPYNLYTFYRLHNYHSLIYAAMFAGQYATAIDAVTRMEESVPEGVLRMRSPPLADWLENFLAARVHVFIRFGRWHEIIRMELPEDQELYCVTTATMHYAKGLAFAATGLVAMAKKEREAFHEARARVPTSRRAYNCKAIETLTVASAMLDGEIAYREGNFDAAWKHLRHSTELDDKLPYSEPWAWMQPARHAYAALLLEQGHVEDAAREYRADLGLDTSLIRPRRHPKNVWALQGYHECLIRMGRVEDAAVIEPALRLAMAVADVPIRASCFCRRDTASAPEVIDIQPCKDGNGNGKGSRL